MTDTYPLDAATLWFSRSPALFYSKRRPRFGYARRTTVPHLNRCGVGALSRMGQVLGEKNDRDVFARACFSCWNDIRKAVTGIVAARLVPARCDDLRTTDLHPLAVRPAPVTVDHVCQ